MDYKKERRLLVYLVEGQNDKIEMRASRDYTAETGIASFSYEIAKETSAAQVFALIQRLIGRRGDEIDSLLISNIQYLLSLKPEFYEQLESESRIVRRLSDHELWQPAIEQAMTATEANKEKWETLRTAVQTDFYARDAAKRAQVERNNRR